MRAWRERLLTLGDAVTFDYPYGQARGRGMPDPLPGMVKAHREALAEARGRYSGPVVLVGKSTGARISCHVSLDEEVDALISLGYPLNRSERDDVLLRLQTPILFVQGERDAFCPLDQLERVRAQMSAPNELHVVEDANHSLEVPDRQRQEDANQEIIGAIAAFLRRHAVLE
jgi:predicted alpha/beta-hydrolase family hydrolase